MKREIPTFNITKDTSAERVSKLGEKCEKCGHCCNYSSAYFLEEDIKRIASELNLTKEEFTDKFLDKATVFSTDIHKSKTSKKKGKQYGSCVFLKDNLCAINRIKPLHCRVGSGCSEHGEELSIWYALNHLVNPDDPQSIRDWAIYLQTHPSIPGGELRELVNDDEELKDILSHRKLK